MKINVFIVLSMILANPLAADTLYKYTDDNGQVHYTDRPPRDKLAESLDIRVESYLGAAEISERRDDYAAALAARTPQPVVIYTTDWCRVCKKAKRYMDNQAIRYSERDIEKNAQAKRDYDRLGGKGVPLIQVGDRTMHGFSADTLDTLLAQQ